MQKQRDVLPAQNESQAFAWPEWIQTKEAGPDMYYASWNLTGSAIVVRGPYLQADQQIRKFRERLNCHKAAFCGVNHLKIMETIWAVPDLKVTQPHKLGNRHRIDGRRTYPFLIMTDIVHPKRHGSHKAEAEESLVKTVCLRDLMMHRDPNARRNFLIAVLFLHVWDIPNTHYKDILWEPVTCQFWSLGEAMPDICIDTRDLFGQALKQSDRRIMAQILTDHWLDVRCNYVCKWVNLPNLPISVSITAGFVSRKTLDAMLALI